MAYDFEQAQKAGVTPNQMFQYLKSKGREDEYVQKFGNVPNSQSTQAIAPNQDGGFPIRDVPAIGGSIIGEAIGAPFGGLPGASLGGAIGGGLGESATQAVEKVTGQREDFEPKKIGEAAAYGALSPLIFAGGKAVLKPSLEIGGKLLSPLTRVAGKGLSAIKATLPGISDSTAQTIKLFPREVEEFSSLAKEEFLGKQTEIVDTLKQAVPFIKNQAGELFQKSMSAMEKAGTKFSFNAKMAMEGINSTLQKYRVQIGKKSLNFGDSFSGNKTANRIVEDVWDDIRTTQIKTIDDLRALKSRAYDRLSGLDMSIGNKTPEAVKIVGKMVDTLDNALPQALQEANKAYSKSMKLIQGIRYLIPEAPNLPGQTAPAAVNKVLRTGKDEVKQLFGGFFDELEKQTGIDLQKGIDILNAAKEINPKLIPQDASGLINIIQKAANPAIGQIKLEGAKLAETPVGQAVKRTVPKIKNFMKGAGKAVIKGGIYEGIKNANEK